MAIGASPDLQYELVKLGDDGELLWRLALPGSVTGFALDNDGTIVSTTRYASGGAAIAWDPDGRLQWHTATPDDLAPPLLDAEGSIYAGSQQGVVYSFAIDGELRWRLPLPEGRVTGWPSLGADGTLYVPSSQGLYAIGSN